MNKYSALFFLLTVVSCRVTPESPVEIDVENQSQAYIEYGYSTDSRLNEISGMIESVQYPNNFWVHNDSGDQPRIFRVNRELEIVQEVQIEGVTHVDWEDIAYGNYGSQKTLFIGDIGDNLAVRDQIEVYLLTEPEEEVISNEPLRSLQLSYPDGPRDAEALLYDDNSNEIVIITKRDDRSRVYTYPLDASDVGLLNFEGELQLDNTSELETKSKYRITAADAISDKSILIKNYQEVYLYPFNDALRYADILIMMQPIKLEYKTELQGEAISLEINHQGYWVTSECADDGSEHQAQPLYYYPFKISKGM